MMKIVALLICFLCGFTSLKVFDIQFVEFLLIPLVPVSLLATLRAGRRDSDKVPPALAKGMAWFGLMLALMLVGSFLSMRLDFYPPGDFGILKTPPYASLVRWFQVFNSVGALLVVGLAVRKDRTTLDMMLFAFVLGALVNAAWGILSWATWGWDVELSGAYEAGGMPRIRGFFAEGGPFGVYLAGAILAQIIRYKYLRSVSLATLTTTVGVLLIAFLGAQSKAGLLLVCGMALYLFYLRRSVGISFLIISVSIPVILASSLWEGLQGYYYNLENYRISMLTRPDDYNLIMGRIMATVLLPRIVAIHPILGIGIGNYSLVRNDPEILRGLPTTPEWDLPGLGTLGYVAELGIPLTLLVLWLYAYPMRASRGLSGWLGLLSAYPLMAALFGVQMNFCYPWVIAGLALAAGDIEKTLSVRRPMEREVRLPGSIVPIRLRSQKGRQGTNIAPA